MPFTSAISPSRSGDCELEGEHGFSLPEETACGGKIAPSSHANDPSIKNLRPKRAQGRAAGFCKAYLRSVKPRREVNPGAGKPDLHIL